MQLGVTQQQLGWLLGLVGLLAACVNGVVVPALMRLNASAAGADKGKWLLMATCSVGQTGE